MSCLTPDRQRINHFNPSENPLNNYKNTSVGKSPSSIPHEQYKLFFDLD